MLRDVDAEMTDMRELSRKKRLPHLVEIVYAWLWQWDQIAGASPWSQDSDGSLAAKHWSPGRQAQDDGPMLPSNMRHLTDISVPVSVSTPRELEDAILQGRHHIVVTAHLDLTSLPLRSTTVCPDGCESPLPEVRETMSIRGECVKPPDDLDVAVFARTPGAAGLLPFQERQCLIITNEDPLLILSTRLWLDNLYLRAVYHNAPNFRPFQFTTLSGFPPLRAPLTGQGRYYVTRTTFQGDGVGPAAGVWADEPTYIGNCTFANLGGDGSDTAACGDCTGNVNAAGAHVRIVNSTFFDPVRANLTNYVRAWGGGSVLMTGCSFASPPDINHTLFYARDNSTVYADDASIRVRADSGPEVAASPAADATESGFPDRSDPWLMNVMNSVQEVVQPRPAYPAPLAPVPPLPPAAESSPGGDAALSREPLDATAGLASAPSQRSPPPAAAVAAAVAAGVVAAALLLACVVFVLRRRRQQRRGTAEKLPSGTMAGRNGTYGSSSIGVMPGDDQKWPDGATRLQNVSMHVTPSLTAQDHTALRASHLHVADLPTQLSGAASHVARPLQASTYWATTVDFDKPLASSAAPALSKLDLLHSQLSSVGSDAVLLERYLLLGPNHRRQGGQGVVAFAKGVHDDHAYALKFFLDRAAFLAERDLYRSQALGKLLPRVHAEYDPQDTPSREVLKDRAGRPLPPCIVMERGESLPDWSRRAKPDVFQSVAVLAHVATRLRDMHDSGYAHRDIKPENLMFLPRENRWTVIDFGCASAVGEVAALAYTLVYAAPEVAAAVAAGAKTVTVDPAVDAWALGVVAFELLTGQSAFNLVTEGRDSVLGKLLGAEDLPWEGDLAEKNPVARRRLGLFREPVLSLLRRDPAQRATLAQFCRTTNSVFSSPTTVERP